MDSVNHEIFSYMRFGLLKHLIRSCTGVVLGCAVSVNALAAMTPLNSDELAHVDGEGTGVQFSLNLQINGTMSSGATPTWTPSPSCVTSTGAPGSASGFCRFGVQENNVYNWLLLKDFNGFINIPKLVLYGTTVQTSASTNQAAMAFQILLPSSGDKSSQININNLYTTFALATSPCYGNSGGTVTVSATCTAAGYKNSALEAKNNQTAYYDSCTFNSAACPQYVSVIDAGKETGIMGIRMSGNLNVGGTLNVFSK